MTCLRCGKSLNRGKKYCSRDCSNKHKVELQNQQISVRSHVPRELEQAVKSYLPDDQANLVLSEMAIELEQRPIQFPIRLEQSSLRDIVLSMEGSRDMRPGSRLRYDIIDQMIRSGPVMFAIEMKRAQVTRVFSKGRYKVVSPDKELAEVATAALDLILPKMANDFTWSAFAYGTSFQEEVWEWKSKYQLGLSKSKAASTEFLVPKVPASVNPRSVAHIRREKGSQRFDGFAQRRSDGILQDLINVDARSALVIPLNERFGNLWGESFLKTLYLSWLWYEIVFRTMFRYMERMAMPVTVGRAPSRATVTIEGSTTPVRAMDLALTLAGNVAKSNAVAIPSDRDEQGNYLWDLGYLSADGGRVDMFLSVLEFLSNDMIKSALFGENTVTRPSGGVGSYNQAQIHAEASAWTTEMLAILFLHYINLYFMPDFSLYNRGENGPPIYMVTQAIDQQEREMLMKILNTAGSSDEGKIFFEMLDWRRMAETGNIPVLKESEVTKRRQDRFDDNMERQKKQQEVMKEFAKENEPPQNNNGQQPPSNPQVKQEDIDRLPLILGPSELEYVG